MADDGAKRPTKDQSPAGLHDPTGVRDVAEFERAQESGGTAHETPELLRLLVQSVRDYAIFALDASGHVLTWNAGALRFKGWTADEIVGRHFSVFYPAEPVAGGFPQYELEVAAATGRFEDEGWRVRKDGSLFWASVVITALFEVSEKLVGFAKVTRDLTERQKAQERAIADARRVAEMEAASRAKSEFLATLSHGLRTPLRSSGDRHLRISRRRATPSVSPAVHLPSGSLHEMLGASAADPLDHRSPACAATRKHATRHEDETPRRPPNRRSVAARSPAHQISVRAVDGILLLAALGYVTPLRTQGAGPRLSEVKRDGNHGGCVRQTVGVRAGVLVLPRLSTCSRVSLGNGAHAVCA